MNVPQSKAVSLTFIGLKASIFGMIGALVARGQAREFDSPTCRDEIDGFLVVMIIVYILGIIVDLLACVYFFCSTTFRKLEFYIVIGFHVLIALVQSFGGIAPLLKSECGIGSCLFFAVVGSNIILLVNTAIVMWGPLYLMLKYLHFGSNLTWVFIWFEGVQCLRSYEVFIVLVHVAMSVANGVTLLAYRFYGRETGIVRCWRALNIICTILMLLCWLCALVSGFAYEDCPEARYMQRAYQRYGVFEIFPPLLILIFLRNENGDPRAIWIKGHE